MARVSTTHAACVPKAPRSSASPGYLPVLPCQDGAFRQRWSSSRCDCRTLVRALAAQTYRVLSLALVACSGSAVPEPKLDAGSGGVMGEGGAGRGGGGNSAGTSAAESGRGGAGLVAADSGGMTGRAAAGSGGAPANTAFAQPAPGSKFFLGANFWNIGWEGSGDYFMSGVDFRWLAAHP